MANQLNTFDQDLGKFRENLYTLQSISNFQEKAIENLHAMKSVSTTVVAEVYGGSQPTKKSKSEEDFAGYERIQAKLNRMNALYEDRMNRLQKQIETKADKEALKKLEDRYAADMKRLSQTLDQRTSEASMVETRLKELEDQSHKISAEIYELQLGGATLQGPGGVLKNMISQTKAAKSVNMNQFLQKPQDQA